MRLSPLSPPGVLIFDVNETLLRFSGTLHYSLVLTASGQYRPFPEIGVAAGGRACAWRR